MHVEMYSKFLQDDFDLHIKDRNEQFIKTGTLISRSSNMEIPVREYIPRFCCDDYCSSFSLQWRRFPDLQHDSKSGYRHSYTRVATNTKWDMHALEGKSILDCGCGPGRFTEVFLRAGADVVGVDMSDAIDVNLQNNGLQKNLMLLQCSITQMSFLYRKFDYVFCYGVLQHTPKPEQTFHELVQFAHRGGKISIDIYRKKFIPNCWTTPKYVWRPVTTRMKKETLLKIIEWYIPGYISFDTIIRRIPRAGELLTGLMPIPCWNYIHKGYSKKERIQHAVMDTFDALSCAYDIPKTLRDVQHWYSGYPELAEIDVFYGSNGIVGNATKK
ncbi:class I SAM-dependent methyltransferase [Candidatus Omnitrophota bacterium]